MSEKQSFCAACPLQLVCKTRLDPERPTPEQLAACGEHYIAVYSLLFKHVVHADAPVSSEEPPEVRRRRLGKATVALATVALQPIPPDQLTSPSEAGSAPISEQWSPAQKVLAACGVAACTTRCSTSPQAAVDTVH